MKYKEESEKLLPKGDNRVGDTVSLLIFINRLFQRL